MNLKIIAKTESDFPTKFGLPRQSGIVEDNLSRIVFEKEYASPEAIRGLDGYSHIWLIWGFSQIKQRGWSPTVRPPRLGGNKRMGVFATRSPNRPNPLGLSCVRLAAIEDGALIVDGADLMDGTPIYDIKPDLPLTDSRPNALGGFAAEVFGDRLEVDIDKSLLELVPENKQHVLIEILKGDPRPAYHNDDRIYGFQFADFEIKFTVKNGILTVINIS